MLATYPVSVTMEEIESVALFIASPVIAIEPEMDPAINFPAAKAKLAQIPPMLTALIVFSLSLVPHILF